MSELQYFAAEGLSFVRLPILWERLEPNLFAQSPNTDFNTTYVGYIKAVLSEAASQNIRVLVDLHDYGGYGGYKIGSSKLQISLFSGMWKKLAKTLAGSAGLHAYDLMNEPNAMPSPAVWPQAAQAAVNAIRAVDTHTKILVEGDDWASAGSWITDNKNLSIKDSAHRLAYEAHVYGDRDNSGTHFDWATEEAYGVTVNTIAQRVAVFTGWCKAKGNRCMIGEVGVGNDASGWNTELANGFTAMASGGIAMFTYWAGGPWWGSYPMSLEPTGNTPAPQLSVVRKYAN